VSPYGAQTSDEALLPQPSGRLHSQPVVFPTLAPEASPYGQIENPGANVQPTITASHRARRASAAEKVLEQIRNREKSNTNVLPNPRNSWIHYQHDSSSQHTPNTPHSNLTQTANNNANTAHPSNGAQASPTKGMSNGRTERRHSLITPAVPPSSPVTSKIALTSSRPTRISRSPSAPHLVQSGHGQAVPPTVPPELQGLLDGEHHTDELSVRFEAGWPLLEQWLLTIGGGSGDGDYGRVVVIYK
jgi:hypothetical protein